MVFLTTNSNPRPGQEVVVARENAPEQSHFARATMEKAAEMAKRFAFPVFVAVAGLIVWFALFVTGMASGEMGAFTYPTAVATIVGIYNAVIMAYPAFLAIRKRDQLFGLRLGIIAASIIIIFFFPIGLRIMASMGIAQALWGLKILGVVAIALHGYAAILLTHYKAADPEVQETLDSPVDLSDQIKAAHAEQVAAAKKAAIATARKDNLAEVVNTASEKRLRSTEVFEAAKATLEEQPATIDRNAKKTELEDVTKAISKLKSEVEKLQREVDTQKNATLKKMATDKLAVKEAELGTLNGEAEVLEEQLAELEEAVRNLPEMDDFNEAKASQEESSKEEKDAQDDLEVATKKSKERDLESADASSVLNGLKDDQAESDNLQKEANQAVKSTWRDVAIWPVVTLLGACFLYAAWYGWVILEVK